MLFHIYCGFYNFSYWFDEHICKIVEILEYLFTAEI